MTAARIAPFSVLLVAACAPADAPELIFDPTVVESELVEVLPCRHSHEHDLRHVRIFADTTSADIFDRCVLGNGDCSETGFPRDSLFVKLEYELPECNAADLVSYTASLRLRDDSYPEGRDWHWQRADRELIVLPDDDGAPSICLGCHIHHCAAPNGFDLRCYPD